VITGDVHDEMAVAEAVRGQDGVLSALGMYERKPNTLLSDAMRTLVRAMEAEQVKRLLMVSSLGVGDSKGQLGPIYNAIILPLLLKEVFADKETAETVVKESALDWTIVRPGRLTNARLSGKYRAGPDAAKGRWFPKVSRANTADFMLNALERNQYVRETPGLAE
jgi:putative NADH-flavin reductase